jgi:hypothetical protein
MPVERKVSVAAASSENPWPRHFGCRAAGMSSGTTSGLPMVTPASRACQVAPGFVARPRVGPARARERLDDRFEVIAPGIRGGMAAPEQHVFVAVVGR